MKKVIIVFTGALLLFGVSAQIIRPNCGEEQKPFSKGDLHSDGAVYYQNLTKNEEVQKAASLEAIVSLTHHFYKLAEDKNQSFDEGTIVLEDNDFKVYNLLREYVTDRYTGDPNHEQLIDYKNNGAYPRRSSHFNDYYDGAGKTKTKHGWRKKKPVFTHYGIDIIDDKLTLPLGNHRHILFGKVDEEKKLMFIKMEQSGLGPHDIAGHAFGWIRSVARRNSPVPVPFCGSDDEKHFRKERVPKDFIKKFVVLAKDPNSPLKQDLRGKIKAIKKCGIQKMVEIDEQISAGIDETWRSRWDKLKKEYTTEEYDHPEIRIGREVILTSKELEKTQINKA